MTHPQVRGYHEIRINWPPESSDITDMFIGRFQSDGRYHLLGHRPRKLAYLFSEDSESNLDIGVVRLPAGKTKLGELVVGEIFEIDSTDEPRATWQARYLGHA